MTRLEIIPLGGMPEVTAGDDLAALIGSAAASAGGLLPGDVVVVAHKVVSKAEGATVDLATVKPTARARFLAAEHGKDPRAVQVVLDQSASIVRQISTRHGFVCANAGVDASNAGDGERLVVLPRDPDASARTLRAALDGQLAVVITDSFGRAWRHGQCDVAIGIAGLAPLDDWRGRDDSGGRGLNATWIAVADEAAAAADLARDKTSRTPVVVIRGLGRHVTQADGPGAAALLRAPAEDLFG